VPGKIDELAGLPKMRRLTRNRLADFALLHESPLIAGLAMKLIACARRNDDWVGTALSIEPFPIR
jgi:hypothetical protein